MRMATSASGLSSALRRLTRLHCNHGLRGADLKRPSLFTMTLEDQFTEVVDVGGVPFLYFPGEQGGRLIPAKHIKSIVPDFKGVGSMVFLTDSDKAVKINQTPKEITYDLNN